MIIQRTIFAKLWRQHQSRGVSILIGARQVGKSTLLAQLAKEIRSPSRYLNLENPIHLNIFKDGYTSFIKEVPEQTVFIDEFHYYPNITSVFKAVFDLHPEKKIYASGSSSLWMHTHLKESLAGRKTENIIYPLSFQEWLTQYNLSLPGRGEYIPLELKHTLEAYLDEFLIYGALPGLVHLNDDLQKREYLFNIYQTYISKDIKAFLKEESIMSFNKMIEYLVLNNTATLNHHSLSRLIGLSHRQVARQIEVMEGTYVLGILKPFFTNKNKEIKKAPKVYFYDQGMANVITNDFRPKDKRPDTGALLEQFVYWEIRKSLDIRFSLKYWRLSETHEVDFILEKDKEPFPVEVKRRWEPGKVPSGIKAFFKYYPQTTKAAVLTDCQDTQITYQDKTIYFLPWYRAGLLKDYFN